MKKEEEIEKLSQSILKTIDSVASLTVTKEEENIFHQGFYSGYRQCEKQQYTEEDIRKAIQVGISAEAGDYPEGFTYKLGITLEDYFIWCIKFKDKQD